MSFFATLNDDSTYAFTMGGYTALVLVMIALLLIGCALFGKNKRFSAKQLAFSAMAIALAFLTSMLKLIELPMGGSITMFSMLFIVLIGYWYGLGAGLTTAFAYGILQLIIKPYVISFPQMMIDYPFAFGALGLSGFFSNSKYGLLKGYLTGVFGRFVFAVLSGVIFFGAYAPDTFPNPFAYSVAYNGSYIGVEALITMILISIPPVASALNYVKKLSNN